MGLSGELMLFGVDWANRAGQAVEYWSELGYRMGQGAHGQMHGERGSALGNMASFSPRDWVARVSLQPTVEGRLLCRLTVDTTGQALTEWDRVVFSAELSMFAHLMRTGEWKREVLADYVRRARRGTLMSVATLGFRRKIDSETLDWLAREGVDVGCVSRG